MIIMAVATAGKVFKVKRSEAKVIAIPNAQRCGLEADLFVLKQCC